MGIVEGRSEVKGNDRSGVVMGRMRGECGEWGLRDSCKVVFPEIPLVELL